MKSSFLQRHSHLLSILAPILAGVIFIALACLNLTSSIWFDESFSAYLTRGSFADIWNLTAQDVHPPLFYFCLKVWSSLFGTSDIAMRFMSVFFGCLAIVFAFQLLKKHFGLKAASFATLFMAISPIFIRYGQEMRMYTLILALVLAASYSLSFALETDKRRYWLAYALLICAGMWTHYFSALAWLAHLAYIIYRKKGIKRTLKDKNLLLAYGIAILLYLPWIPQFFRQVATVQSGFWIPALSLVTPVDYFSNILLFSDAEFVTGWLAVLALLALILIVYLSRRLWRSAPASRRHALRFLLFLIFIPPLLLVLLSLPPLTSMFVDRYIIYSMVLTWLFFGLVLEFAISHPLDKKLLAWVSVVVILACSVIGIINVTNREPKGYIKDIITSVSALAQPGEAILMNSDWNYYDAVFYTSADHPVYFVEDWTDYYYGSLEPIRLLRANLVEHFSDFAKDHPTFWFITDLPQDGGSPTLPASNLRTQSEVATDHFLALELTSK